MASLIPGFEYDIFISYRQKDNRGDGWVSIFVEALQTELESTFKDEVSVYFDINPHDGLLGTHDVDASLRNKLKCLIFIPILSRTYCDPGSFAWEHEFRSFIRLASNDDFGLKIKLPNGNVGSRVLPVRIYNLDATDIRLCESVLGGVVRDIDFVYTEPGVNRPLTKEDDEEKNQAGTSFRNQINKTANAIREIISGMKAGTGKDSLAGKSPEQYDHPKTKEKEGVHPKLVQRLLIAVLALLILIGVFIVYKTLIPITEAKTIAVVPFTNPVNDPALMSYSVGTMDAIITKLQQIKNLTVRSRFSSLQYLDTKEPLSRLKEDLRINYLVDISFKGTPGNLRMWVGLTRTRTNKQLWAQEYEVDEKQLMTLFTEVTEIIADKLNVTFSPDEIRNVKLDITRNPDAYVNYLAGNARLFSAMGSKFVYSEDFASAIEMYDRAIAYDPDFANAYARRAMARSWSFYTGQLSSSQVDKCWSDILNAERIDKNLPDVQIAYGFYYYYFKRDYINALISFHTASLMDKEDYQPLFFMALVYRKMGDWEKSQKLIHRVLEFNPREVLYLLNIGLSYIYLHNYDSALIYNQKAIDLNPSWSAPYINKMQALILKYGNTPEARATIDSAIVKTGERLKEDKILLDIYDGKYSEALIRAETSDSADFTTKDARYLYLATIYGLLKKPQVSEKYYDSAIVVLNLEILKDSTNSLLHSYLGIAHAGRGNTEAAISEGKKAIDFAVKNKDNLVERDMRVTLAQIYTMTGEYSNALNMVKDLLREPSIISIKLLESDPAWKPLTAMPAFDELAREYKMN